MDSTTLELAYAALLRAIDAVLAAPANSRTLQQDEWNADQQLAHLIAVDAGILAVTSSIAAGSHATFDNRLSLDAHNLARIIQRCGGMQQMRKRVDAQGRALCQIVEQLAEEELRQPVPTLLVSAGTLLVDQTISLRDLISGIADDHLPRHTQQLLNLLPTQRQPDDPPQI